MKQVLVFRLGDELLAYDVGVVNEIIQYQEIASIPTSMFANPSPSSRRALLIYRIQKLINQHSSYRKYDKCERQLYES
jgi:hypothetical protein